MNKNELIKAVAGKTNLKVSDMEKAINGTIVAITAELKKKGSVTLVGFGTFKVADRKARAGSQSQNRPENPYQGHQGA
jgi:DNA-binding protein HU-beta